MLQRMKELISTLRRADDAYYVRDNPIMTDRAYDLLYEELAKLEYDSGIILAGSPTQSVSGCQRRCDFVVFRRTGNVEK